MVRHAFVVVVLLAASLAGCASEPTVETQSCVDDCPPAPSPAPVPEPAPPEPTAPLPWHPSDGAAEVTDILLDGVQGHQVPATVYRPLVAGPDATVPILLHSHGWSLTRTSDPEAFQPFLAAGFGVVSFDMRGHGDAAGSSVARVHHLDYEIADVQAIVDQVATWDWVHLDAPGDPRIGTMGSSYGGGYQLLLAAVDDRVDAIAPEITWHDLLRSLAPDGAPKSAWLDLLYWGAAARGTKVAQEIHEGYAWLQASNEVPDGSKPGQPDLATPFADSSPASHAGAIDVPTLLFQGAPDTLFSFNEAVDNYHMVQATGAPVKLVTHLNGHILNTNGTFPDPPAGPDVGLQPASGPDPCGDPAGLIIRWYERHLIGREVETGPTVCLALEDGSTVTGDDMPLPGTRMQTVALGDALVAVGPRAVPWEQELLAAEEPTVVAGVPRLRATAEAPTDAIVYWTLEHVSGDARHVVLSQVTPTRISASEELDTDLLGIAVALAPGDRLVLVASDRSEQYVHNESRTPGLVTFSGIEVDVPIVS